MNEPKNRREARKWIRLHWAELIGRACMGAVADIGNDHLEDVWEDECDKIAKRLKVMSAEPDKLPG